MNPKAVVFYMLLFLGLFKGQGQNAISINAVLNDSTQTFDIEQKMLYTNTSKETLTEVYLNDWANSFSKKSTPLGQRFAEDYQRRFHFARTIERGFTRIYSITDENVSNYSWERPPQYPDVVKVFLKKPLLPGEKVHINLLYRLKIPSEKFTRFGYDDAGNYKLKYWYITPAVFDGEWQIYSDKNLGDQFTPPANLSVKLSTRPHLDVISPLSIEKSHVESGYKTTYLSGNNRVTPLLYLSKNIRFDSLFVNSKKLITNLEDDDLKPEMKNFVVGRILDFLKERLGEYPHEQIMITRDEYLNDPVYGLNQLPQFIRPFPDNFQYDIKQLKTLTKEYLRNSLIINPRKEQWIYDAIGVYLMMEYTDRYYPNTRLIGNLSEIIGIRWFHAADLEFNDQYPLLYLHMARMNLDQALATPQDSLLKFNKNIANPYKAGVGLNYVNEFLGSDAVDRSISEFYSENVLQLTGKEDFEKILSRNSDKDVSWFFEDYVASGKKIDFRIKNIRRQGDSLLVSIKDKRDNRMPVSLYGLNNGKVIYKTWVENTSRTMKLEIPADSIERLALNYEGNIPEINQRDNYKAVTKLLNKPLQFRIFQDVEDPRYNQVFFMPEFSFNLYDGIAAGPRVYNKTVLNRNFEYKIAPKFGFNSKTLVGSASLGNTHYYEDQNLFSLRYGISGIRYSYGFGLFYEKFTPYMSFHFRDPYLRDNERQSLIIRNVNVRRDIDPENPATNPDYNVFNVGYRYSDANLVDHISGALDYELSKNFGKLSLNLEYRKLFLKNNRQINFRIFAGTFLYNDETDSDFFSFALDRPTDYLFDYNYYGRSQSSGLFSQQLIMAEGGFKSKLQPEFANQWLTTFNASTNLWKWIFVYGDAGLVKNRLDHARFVYDSGIRVSLVQDYFEVFFPVYSNLGWEIAQPNYDQKIRFIVSLDMKTLVRLFTREWY